MLRIYILLIFLVGGVILSYSQESTKKDSIIYLDEVLINDGGSKKTEIIKTKGRENAFFSIVMESTFVTLISEIPEGYLDSIKFFFNDRKGKEYKDRKFELVIFKRGINNFPAEKLITRNLHFEVKESHKGEIELDLSQLDLRSSEELFFGLKLLKEEHNTPLGFTIASNHNKRSQIFFKVKDSDEWQEVPGINFKIELKIENISG